MATTAGTSRALCSTCWPIGATRSRAVIRRNVRFQSSEASTSISSADVTVNISTSAGAQGADAPSTRIVASMILSRPPRQMQPLSEFEKHYYRYARQVTKAISSDFNPEFYFRKGSQGEQAYKELVATADKGKELESVPSEDNLPEHENDDDLHNFERKKSRTLYLLAKKTRKEHAWQFPQGEVEADESLSQAAKRELLEEFGSELDIWQPGRVPAAHYGYKLPKATKQGQTESQVFFMPARILRGQPSPNQDEGLEDYAWCTMEEVKERVNNDEYYKSIERALSA